MGRFLSALYLQFVAITSRIKIVTPDMECHGILEERRPAIFVYWQMHVYFLIYFLGVRRFWIMMNPRTKKDHLSKLAETLGAHVSKGSIEGGGRHALVMLIEKLKQGNQVALAADGSRGPERQCKAGAFILAQEFDAPMVPISWTARFTIKIKIGETPMLLPLPFTSIEVRLGTPLRVTKHYKFAELEEVRNQLAANLNKLMPAS